MRKLAFRALNWCLGVPLAYAAGIWLLIRHPILFCRFSQEWLRFKDQIEGADLIRDSGLNRKQRRKLGLRARV
jgi:hypothetical protein